MTVERKTAFITGAGKGIGYGIAKTLAEEGYDLILHSRTSVQGTEKLANLARTKGLKAHLVQGDLSNVQEVEQIFRRISDLTQGAEPGCQQFRANDLQAVFSDYTSGFRPGNRAGLAGQLFCYPICRQIDG